MLWKKFRKEWTHYLQKMYKNMVLHIKHWIIWMSNNVNSRTCAGYNQVLFLEFTWIFIVHSKSNNTEDRMVLVIFRQYLCLLDKIMKYKKNALETKVKILSKTHVKFGWPPTYLNIMRIYFTSLINEEKLSNRALSPINRLILVDSIFNFN